MQQVATEWEDTNRDLFTSQANIIIQINTTDDFGYMFSGEHLISLAHIKNGDVFSGILTQDRITFTLNDRERRLRYDAENDNGLYSNARVDIWETFQGAGSISGGRYYIMDISKDGTEQNYTFTCGTILSFMTEKCGSDYSGDALMVANEIIAQANKSSGVPEVDIKTHFDEAVLSAVEVDIRTEDNYSLAEALQLIANACCCVLFVDRSGAIHIEKIGSVSTHCVLARRFLYKPLEVTYAERVGNVTLTSDHGHTIDGTEETGDRIGGMQMITNPILHDMSASHDVVFYTLLKLKNGRKRFRANCRFDPAVDLFDIIVVPNGSTVDCACVTGTASEIFIACISHFHAPLNVALKCDMQAMKISDAVPDLRIKDLELLTFEQIESMTVARASGERI